MEIGIGTAAAAAGIAAAVAGERSQLGAGDEQGCWRGEVAGPAAGAAESAAAGSGRAAGRLRRRHISRV